MPEAEKYKIKNLTVNDLLKDEFINKIKKADIDINAISLVLVSTSEKDGKKIIVPIAVGHGNENEFKEKVIHLDSPDTQILNKILKVLEEIGGK